MTFVKHMYLPLLAENDPDPRQTIKIITYAKSIINIPLK